MKPKTYQISLKAIPDTGLTVTVELGRDWFARWQAEDPALEFSEAEIAGTVTLEKHGKDVLVRGHLAGRLVLTCSRCLDNFAAPVEADFDLLLAPGPGPNTPEQELAAGDLDLDYYRGGVVDLESILKEQIILMLPLKPLCRELCRGLCPQCGVNLNRETCNCAAQKKDSSFARLADLKAK